MTIKERVSGEVGRAVTFVERLRDRYLKMYAEALSAGNERLAEVAHLTDVLGPRVRSAVDHGIESMQQRLDQLNQSLAERAVPSDRKGKIGRLKDETAAAPVAQGQLRVVSSSRGKNKAVAKSVPAQSALVKKAAVSKAAPAKKSAAKGVTGTAKASGKAHASDKPAS